MSAHPVITVFAIYEGDEILSQGGFDVAEEPRSYEFPSRDGCIFCIESSYSGKSCSLNVRCLENESETCSCDILVPINRTKTEWKETNLGDKYRLYYRSRFEEVA